jgi:response regulator RpfG family c-di-GMP phosphodiesterase
MSHRISVMLVDDNETDNYIARSIINHTNLADQIVDFTSAIQAKEYLLQNINKPQNLPDLILLDINMPIVSGIVFLHELETLALKLFKDSFVVILSGFEKTSETDEIVNSNRVLRYLTKPMTAPIFEEIVKDLTKMKLKVA